jgi:hypothetical protein
MILFSVIVGAFIGGFVSAAIGRCQRAAQRREFLRLLSAEFSYWQGSGDADGADDTQQSIAIGAVGSVSNVMGALTGHPAPWHSKNTQTKGSGES